ncbi:MAG TPA: GAF domain-containing protein [Acidimicrobiales bacterium]|nr:GAF domain-containing protein [Acidimicrobiales bacterium]
MADVATAASQLGDLSGLLNRLADLTLEATGADRVSLFLLDQDQRALRLWSTTGRQPSSELWNLGLSMPAITLDDVPARRQLFAYGVPVGIPDARRSNLVPREWAEAFQLQAVVVAPLRCGNDNLGLLAVDYRSHRDFTPELIRLIATIAGSCALAVGHAWLSSALSERNANLKSLLDASRALSSPASLDDVAEQVAEAIIRVFHAQYLSVHLLDERRTRYRTLVQRNIRFPAEGSLADLPRPALCSVVEAWQDATNREPVFLATPDAPLDAGHEAGAALVLPLVRPSNDVFGFLVLGLPGDDQPNPTTVDLATALASHVAFAVERVRLDEQMALGAEFARTVLDLYEFDADDPQGLLAGLRRAVPPTLGFRVHGLRLAPELGDLRVATSPPAEARQIWKQWRRRKTRPEVHQVGRDVYAPVWRDGRVVGMVLAHSLRDDLAQHERELLEALAAALGHAIDRVRMRAAVRSRERELALAEERAHVAQGLQATVGHMLQAIEICGRDVAEALRGRELGQRAGSIVALAHTALAELHDTARALPALAYDRGGLEATLTEVVGELSGHLDAAADFEVRGEPRALSLEVEQSLIRMVHETLSRVERHGRASAIAVRLEFRPGEVELVIRDDGTDLATREQGQGGLAAHFGLRLVQRRLEALGGKLLIDRPSPRGLELRARVPA